MTRQEELELFNLKSNELIECQYILADIKIVGLLKAIACSETLVAILKNCLSDFDFEEAKKKLIEAKQTVTIIETTGNCHLVLICVASNVEEMRYFVNRIYKEIDGISSINAHSVLDVLKGNVISD